MEVAFAQIHHGNLHSKLMGNLLSSDAQLGKDNPRYLRNLTNSTDILETIEVVENEEPVVFTPQHSAAPKTSDEIGGHHVPKYSIPLKNYENDSKENRACNITERTDDINDNDIIDLTPECSSGTTDIPQTTELGQCVDSVEDMSEPSMNDIKKSLKRVYVAALHTDRDLRNICKSMKLKLNKPPCQKYLRNYTHAANGPELFGPKNRALRHPDSDDDSDAENGSEYEVEAIRDYSFEKGEHWYLVKWKNWPDETNTWEPKRNLHGCSDMLKEYHDNLKRKREVPIDDSSPKSKKRKINSCILEVCSKSSEDLATLLKLKGIRASEFSCKKSNILKLKKEVKQMYLTASESIKRKNLNKLFESEITLFGDDGLIDFAQKRKTLLHTLKEWEAELNNAYYNNFSIAVENHVDLEGPPENFTYIISYIPGKDITIPEDPLFGCSCGDCFAKYNQCCSAGAGVDFAYDKNGLVRVPSGTPIYECNKLCSCGPDCLNRVVQKGQKIDVLIFRTDDARGWGVKTLVNIKKGTFVMEYNGEVITNEEAERRGALYDGEGRTYLFDLDYDESDPLTVDAAYYGNAAHFINHSCDPNLGVYGVWIEHLDTRIPRVAFFACRNIKKYEELTFDYRMTAAGGQTPRKITPGSPSKEFAISNEDYLRTASCSSRRKPIACRCGTVKCRKYLF